MDSLLNRQQKKNETENLMALISESSQLKSVSFFVFKIYFSWF